MSNKTDLQELNQNYSNLLELLATKSSGSGSNGGEAKIIQGTNITIDWNFSIPVEFEPKFLLLYANNTTSLSLTTPSSTGSQDNTWFLSGLMCVLNGEWYDIVEFRINKTSSSSYSYSSSLGNTHMVEYFENAMDFLMDFSFAHPKLASSYNYIAIG